MKNMKKFMSLLLAAVMVLSMMTVNVFAEETVAGDGQITITDTENGDTVGLEAGVKYNIYRMFDLTLGSDNKSYSYKVTEDWAKFFEAAGANYIELDSNGYVVDTVGEEMGNNGSRVAAFAMEAADYATKNGITPTDTDTTVKDGEELVFDDLPLGYYLITSTYGSSGICMLTTTDKEVTVDEKNIEPGINKFVKEDGEWVKANDAAYGDEVEFKIDITVEKDASGYVLTDVMDSGLTFKTDSVAVKIGDDVVDTSKYTVSDETAAGFKITFGDLETTEKQIVTVTYKATVDHNAAVDKAIDNTATLKFDGDGTADDSDDDKTSSTETYTWDINVFKYTEELENPKALEGAKFVLRDAKEGDSANYYCYNDEEGEYYWGADDTKAIVLTSDENGLAEAFEGLDSGTYYLEEIAAPDGYNMLTERVDVVINDFEYDENGVPTSEDEGTIVSAIVAKDAAYDGYVAVQNNAGTILPGTGGIGTTIFYVAGGIMVIGAATMLLRRRYN